MSDKLNELETRYQAASEILENEKLSAISSIGESIPLKTKMVIIDVFIQKALDRLTERADKYVKYAGFCLLFPIAIAILGIAFLHYFYYPLDNISSKSLDSLGWTGPSLTLEIMKHLSIGLLLATAIGLPIVIGTSLIKEGSRLYNQRNSIRAFRIAFWINNGNVDISEIEKLFVGPWANHVAEADISDLNKAILGGTADALSKILTALGSISKVK